MEELSQKEKADKYDEVMSFLKNHGDGRGIAYWVNLGRKYLKLRQVVQELIGL